MAELLKKTEDRKFTIPAIEESPVIGGSKRLDGRFLKRKSVGGDKTTGTSDIADNTITQAMMQDNAIGQAEMRDDSIGQGELKEEYVAVTVSAGQTSGTGTATSGAKIIGFRPTGNQDQFVDNIAISGTTVTITLGAAATADNTFEVILLKT